MRAVLLDEIVWRKPTLQSVRSDDSSVARWDCLKKTYFAKCKVRWELSSWMRLSCGQRNHAMGMLETGCVHRRVSWRFGCHRITISSLRQRLEETGTFNHWPWSKQLTKTHWPLNLRYCCCVFVFCFVCCHAVTLFFMWLFCYSLTTWQSFC